MDVGQDRLEWNRREWVDIRHSRFMKSFSIAANSLLQLHEQRVAPLLKDQNEELATDRCLVPLDTWDILDVSCTSIFSSVWLFEWHKIIGPF